MTQKLMLPRLTIRSMQMIVPQESKSVAAAGSIVSLVPTNPLRDVRQGNAPAVANDVLGSAESGTAAFLDAMSRAVTGVNVVATDGAAGRYGLTVSAFASVSAEPPLLLVCINTNSPVSAAIESNGGFCVNVLDTDQRRIADAFAGRSSGGKAYEFDAADWCRAPSGAPRLCNAVASFDCAVESVLRRGTHYIVIGEPQAIFTHPGHPLLYTERRYGRACNNTESG